jgi:Meiotically up-regulated gene 113
VKLVVCDRHQALAARMNKDHIISEIQRAVAQNGGKAIGWRRFESHTGIGISEWMKFWPRWGDAVREAGFAPMAFIAAFDDATLLESYAKLTREIGRLPAWSDIKFKANSDPTFPSEKVFRRFKSKEETIKRLKEHCSNGNGWDDVLTLCEAYSPKTKREAVQESAGAEPEIGFVYLLKSGRFYKIGKSNAAGRRERELAIQLPDKAVTVHVIRTDDPTGIEAYWHKRFESKRRNGEWFELNALDVRTFKKRKFM